MGVPGLTTYISERSELYLKPHKLFDGYVVIDGSNIASHLFLWVTKGESAFGGDYDEYYKTVKDFFLMLKKCKVTPIVLLDGGREKKKIKTTLNRTATKLSNLQIYTERYSDKKFYPLFMIQTFIDVMEDLGIFCVRCDFEADVEIAAVSRALNCPVLSYDSDFYIYDVLYIPFSSVFNEPVKFDDSDNYYVRCSLYDMTSFLTEFPGFHKSLLPIAATLLGNDYIDSSIFQKFFHHVIITKNKKKSYSQRKIHGVFHWLKKESFESAVTLIQSHLGKQMAERVLRAINMNVREYTNIFVSESVMLKLKNEKEDIRLKVKNCALNLPFEVLQHYYSCRIHKFIIDMMTLGIYLTFLQIEDMNDQSSHFPSLQLIRDIYILLTPYIKHSNSLKLYLKIKNQYSSIILNSSSNNILNNVCLHYILKEPQVMRLKWLCHITGIDDDDLNIVSTNNWSLFLISFIYWVKKLNKLIYFAHIHALILMAIANQIVQKRAGYFRNYSKFMKSRGNLLKKLQSQPIEVKECADFKEMLKSVTFYEVLHTQEILIPYRQATEKATGSGYSVSTVHLFDCFQSCLYHIMQLNALLNYPLPHLKISDFYSGTLLYNFYLIIRNKPPNEKFGCNLFKDAPNLAKIYVHLYENFCKFSEKDPPVSGKKTKKRKKRKNKIPDTPVEEEVIYYKNDDDIVDDDTYEYNDENNPFSALQNNVM